MGKAGRPKKAGKALSPRQFSDGLSSQGRRSLHRADGHLRSLEGDDQKSPVHLKDLATGARGKLAEVQERQGRFQFRPAMRTGNRDGIAVNGRSHGGKYSNGVAAQQRELGRILLLSLMCLSGLSFWVGYQAGPYGIAGLTWSFSVLISGATFGVLVGFFTAKDGG